MGPGIFADACKWQAFFLGNVLAVMLFVGAGPVKLVRLKGHRWLKDFFTQYIGPFFSINADVIRVISGLLEIATGLTLFVCLWIDQLYWTVRPVVLSKAKVWCLCMCVTIHFFACAQAVMTFDLNRKLISFTSMLTGLNFLVLLLRFLAWPPWWLPPYDQQLLFFYCMFIPLPFVLLAVWHCRYGMPLSEIKKRNEEHEFAARSSGRRHAEEQFTSRLMPSGSRASGYR